MRAKVLAVAAAVAVPLSVVIVVPAASAASKAPATPPAPTASGDGQFMAVAATDADYAGLKADVQTAGGRVLKEMPEIQTMVVKAPKAAKAKLAASKHAAAVATDHIETLSPPDQAMPSPALRKSTLPGANLKPPVTPDPAYFDPGLLWNEMRVRMTQAFRVTTGAKAVTVGVADTGLDFTHVELASKIKASDVVDFTQSENPPICPTYFEEGVTDATLAAKYGGPEKTDWNGHGTWIGGNIAAALDGEGVNGIAPNVKLVPLKISQWCGSAYDSEILDAFLYAADHGIDIVSISFGGYLDRSDPGQNAIYKQYVAAVKYAKRAGTTIVAAAGNEHLRIGAGGKVLSHGPLTTPGTAPREFQDYYGLYETPGGIPGVVDVSSTGNLVNASSSKSCRAQTQTADVRDVQAEVGPAPADRRRAGGSARLLQQLRASHRRGRPGWGAHVQPAPVGPGRHAGLPVHRRRRHRRLGGLQHHLELGDGDPVLHVHGRRLPARPVLRHHPGHVDGDAPRLGGGGADRQRPAELAGQCGRPRAGAGVDGKGCHRQHHARALGHRHVGQ